MCRQRRQRGRPLPWRVRQSGMPAPLPTSSTLRQPEPRWQALIALLAVGGLFIALPEELTVGPRWLLLTVVGALSVPLVISNRAGAQRLNVALGVTVTAVLTAPMIASPSLPIATLSSHK